MLRLLDYFLVAFPGFLITAWAQWRIVRAYAAGSKVPAASGRTGAEAARAVLNANGLSAIAIEPAAGELSNHYDPLRKVLRLSRRMHDGRSLTALGVASHEVGHAIQDAAAYPGLVVRNLVVPLAGIGSQLFWLLLLAGLVLGMDRLILAGLVLFSSVLILQLLNLPVELDASRRARQALLVEHLLESDEEQIVANVQTAAAWTYVAAAATGGPGLIFWSRDR
ncbi:MAG: zinc metallopeptidase [Isosphaeraceae bacterium]